MIVLAIFIVQDIAQQLDIKAETVRRWLRKGLLQGNVHVDDNSVGIDLERQIHIFDRFYRINCSRARHERGAGVLLPLS